MNSFLSDHHKVMVEDKDNDDPPEKQEEPNESDNKYFSQTVSAE